MKLLTLIFFISIGFNVCAQKPIFVRVFNLSGKKIYKGNVLAVTDSSLQLVGRKGSIHIPASNIGSIMTKRSEGSNIFISSVIGGLAGGIIGATTAGKSIVVFSEAESATLGTLLGASIGAGLGALTTLFKNSKRYLIKGDNTKWKVFQTMINESDATGELK